MKTLKLFILVLASSLAVIAADSPAASTPPAVVTPSSPPPPTVEELQATINVLHQQRDAIASQLLDAQAQIQLLQQKLQALQTPAKKP